MIKYFDWRTITSIFIIGMCCYLVFAKPIQTGLDLSGGTHFTIETATHHLPEDQRQQAVDQTLGVYRNRIDEIGVAGTTIQQSGKNRIIVQIPGIETKEVDRIKRILKKQAHLEFKLVVDGPEDSIQLN